MTHRILSFNQVLPVGTDLLSNLIDSFNVGVGKGCNEWHLSANGSGTIDMVPIFQFETTHSHEAVALDNNSQVADISQVMDWEVTVATGNTRLIITGYAAT